MLGSCSIGPLSASSVLLSQMMLCLSMQHEALSVKAKTLEPYLLFILLLLVSTQLANWSSSYSMRLSKICSVPGGMRHTVSNHERFEGLLCED
jgi:hypothetical protein